VQCRGLLMVTAAVLHLNFASFEFTVCVCVFVYVHCSIQMDHVMLQRIRRQSQGS